MFDRGLIGAAVMVAALLTASGGAQAFDQTRYPDLRGEWRRAPDTAVRVVQPRGAVFDPSKAWGPAQQPPLIPEYQARFETNLADLAAGGQDIGETYTCVSPDMPRVTNAYRE